MGEVMKIQGWFLPAVLFAFLTACGGGGGGSAGPANVVETDPEPEQLKAGLFTDAPVTGLRYVQGHREGYTENGMFKYDANRSDPICFYIGSIQLGCASGGDVVTPFDLASAGSPAGLQSGYNISRLLVSLDDSLDEGIQLPESSRSAQGSIDFFLTDGMFATDEVVEELIAKYAPEGTLVSRGDAKLHIADNPDVQQAIQNLSEALALSISEINITWDSSLNNQGVLAHIEAKSNAVPATFEHLYLELETEGSDLYLSEIIYVNSKGDYTSVNMNSKGVPSHSYQDGRGYAFLNMSIATLEDWIITGSYRPRQSAYLIGNEGYESRKEARFIAESRSGELVQIVDMALGSGITDDAMLRLSAAAAAVVNSVACSVNANDTCGTRLEEALVFAVADNSYRESTINWDYSSLSYDLCLPVNIGTSDQSCGFAPNLSQFNIVVNQAYQDVEVFSSWKQVAGEWESTVLYYLEYPAGEFNLVHGKYCQLQSEMKELGDGSYYVYQSLKKDSCELLLNEYTGVRGDGCIPVELGYGVIEDVGKNCDVSSLPKPADWNERKALADKVFERYFSNGVGRRLLKNNKDSSNFGHYYDEERLVHWDEPEWYRAISSLDRVSGAELFFDLYEPCACAFTRYGKGQMFAELNPLVQGEHFAYVTLNEGVYKEKDGREITLKFFSQTDFVLE